MPQLASTLLQAALPQGPQGAQGAQGAQGVAGPPGVVNTVVDAGGPDSNYEALEPLDGGGV